MVWMRWTNDASPCVCQQRPDHRAITLEICEQLDRPRRRLEGVDVAIERRQVGCRDARDALAQLVEDLGFHMLNEIGNVTVMGVKRTPRKTGTLRERRHGRIRKVVSRVDLVRQRLTQQMLRPQASSVGFRDATGNRLLR